MCNFLVSMKNVSKFLPEDVAGPRIYSWPSYRTLSIGNFFHNEMLSDETFTSFIALNHDAREEKSAVRGYATLRLLYVMN